MCRPRFHLLNWCLLLRCPSLIAFPVFDRYVAPEVLSGRLYGPPCDVWACGVLTYILLVRNGPPDGQGRAGQGRGSRIKPLLGLQSGKVDDRKGTVTAKRPLRDWGEDRVVGGPELQMV